MSLRKWVLKKSVIYFNSKFRENGFFFENRSTISRISFKYSEDIIDSSISCLGGTGYYSVINHTWL